MTQKYELLTATQQFLAKQKLLLIDGEWVSSQSSKTFAVENPATGDILAQVAYGQRADLDLAIPGAANAIFFNHGQCCCAGSRLYTETKSVCVPR